MNTLTIIKKVFCINGEVCALYTIKGVSLDDMVWNVRGMYVMPSFLSSDRQYGAPEVSMEMYDAK